MWVSTTEAPHFFKTKYFIKANEDFIYAHDVDPRVKGIQLSLQQVITLTLQPVPDYDSLKTLVGDFQISYRAEYLHHKKSLSALKSLVQFKKRATVSQGKIRLRFNYQQAVALQKL